MLPRVMRCEWISPRPRPHCQHASLPTALSPAPPSPRAPVSLGAWSGSATAAPGAGVPTQKRKLLLQFGWPADSRYQPSLGCPLCNSCQPGMRAGSQHASGVGGSHSCLSEGFGGGNGLVHQRDGGAGWRLDNAWFAEGKILAPWKPMAKLPLTPTEPGSGLLNPFCQ